MPLRLESSNSMSYDVLYHCINSSVSNGILLAGAARLFTVIDPISAGLTGLLACASDYLLDKITPSCSDVTRTSQVDAALKYIFTRFCGYAAATPAANALGYSISFGNILLLSTCTNILMIGVATIVFLIAKQIFPRVRLLNDQFYMAGVVTGFPLIALGGAIIGDRCGLSSRA